VDPYDSSCLHTSSSVKAWGGEGSKLKSSGGANTPKTKVIATQKKPSQNSTVLNIEEEKRASSGSGSGSPASATSPPNLHHPPDMM